VFPGMCCNTLFVRQNGELDSRDKRQALLIRSDRFRKSLGDFRGVIESAVLREAKQLRMAGYMGRASFNTDKVYALTMHS
jgi:hypothetical protein